MSRDERPQGGSDRDDSSHDSERDAWLGEALRHAPDADAGAPPGVRDAILRQAREAAATPAPRADAQRRNSPWSGWWLGLMQPPVAAGFASVMVATLVGVMWWGRPIDEPLREANQPDVAAPEASSTPSATNPSPVAVPETPPAEAAPPPAAREAEAARRVPAQPPQALPPARSDPEGRRESARPDRAMAPFERSAQRKEGTSASPEVATDQVAIRNAAPPPAAAVAAPAATAPPAAAPPAPPAPAVTEGNPPPERKREADALADNTRPAADAATGSAEAKAGARAGAATTPAAAAARSQAATRSADLGAAEHTRSAVASHSLAAPPALADPLARLRSAVAAQPGAWTWQRGSGSEQPMNDAVQGWLAQLDDATRVRWQAVPGAPESGATQTLRLLRDGRLQSTMRIDTTGVQVEPAGTAAVARRAPLPATDAAALAAALERAAP